MSPLILETRINMHNVRFLTPNAGQRSDALNALKLKARQARIDLASSHPTPDQADDLTTSLVSNWSGEVTDARLASIAEIWLRFPVAVCKECVGLDGIAYTKVKDLRTGREEPRRALPANAEIRQWLNDYQADLYDTVKAAEIANRPVRSLRSESEWTPRAADDIGRVQAKAKETIEHLKRACGVPSEEELRQAAERFLEAAAREGH